MFSMGFEVVGSAVFAFGANMSANAKDHSIYPIIVGLLYFSLICFLGSVGGGHFNPAVTLAIFIKEGRANFS